jgi:hypothetical protein
MSKDRNVCMSPLRRCSEFPKTVSYKQHQNLQQQPLRQWAMNLLNYLLFFRRVSLKYKCSTVYCNNKSTKPA